MRPATLRTTLLTGLVCSLLTLEARAADPPPTDAQVRFFETRVRPLLATHCFQCHGPDKQKADLRLDSRDRFLSGGTSGPVVVAGQPDASLLVKAVRHADDLPRMPPKGKLTDREIADLVEWVRAGAPYPASATPADLVRQREFWAFRPPPDPPVPPVADAAWPRTPLDNFVLARLEAKGLKPAPPADRRTLIRRATFDLTGLPPTPDEVEAFVGDSSPDAWEKVVDRLLASPAHGERWGRHWLDVARYADSNGLDENVGHGNAWRYRDWVVAAFNRDLPYDQFVVEQLAGDLLATADPLARNDRLVATGFLSLGPKVLAEVDETKMEMDIIDEQIDTTGKAFLGLTLGCARCHDHKFDPVETEDYYALAGIFRSTRTMEHFTKIARWWENPLHAPEFAPVKAAHDARVAKVQKQIQQLVDVNTASLRPPVPKPPESAFPKEAQAELKRLRDELARIQKEAPEGPSAMGVTEGKVADVKVHVRGNHQTLGQTVARRVPGVLADTSSAPAFDAKQSGRLQLARWLTRPDHPLTARVMVNRVWRWHFGAGLVRSTDNFGRLGDRPVNQPLLDWLARRFVAGGWSVKALHRSILLSSTYRMSSTHDPRAAELDPDNRLLWRFDVRRLEAEAVRDGLLAVSGLLDRTTGGPVLHVKNREFLFDHTSKDMTKYDSRRRAVYLPVIRNNLYDVFQLFDAPDATVLSGDRASTVVAPQALFALNSELVADAGDALAHRVLADPQTTDPARVRRAYELAFGRPATDLEQSRAVALIGRFDAALKGSEPDPTRRRQRAWGLFAHTLLAANEFIYIR